MNADRLDHLIRERGAAAARAIEARRPGHLVRLFGDRRAPDGSLVRDNFAHWFGHSRVVDVAGAPLVVYHGTCASFDRFDVAAPAATPWLFGNDHRIGFFFTRHAGIRSDSGAWSGAAGYARTRQVDGETLAMAGANVVPVYLSLQLPHRMTADEYRTKAAHPNFREELVVLGFDGIEIDDGTFVAFSPAQVKSSIGNSGAFDVDGPDLCDSHAWDALVERERMRA